MTTAEVARLLAVMASIYQNFRPVSMEDAIEAWHMVLADYDNAAITKALRTYMTTDCQFAPTPGQLIQMATPKAEMLNEMQAWALVRKAIENGIYGAETEFAKLPPEVQQAVGDPGQLRAWAMSDLDSLQTVAQSNFQRTYRAVVKRAEDDRLLLTAPERLKIGESNG